MRPLLLDTSVWVEWLRQIHPAWVENTAGRTLFLCSVTVMELFAGVRGLPQDRALRKALEPYRRHRDRLVVPTLSDYERAGELLGELGLGASRHSNDALIAVSARTLGAEVWTMNLRDFEPLCGRLGIPCGAPPR